jgi:hypothetical protein
MINQTLKAVTEKSNIRFYPGIKNDRQMGVE